MIEKANEYIRYREIGGRTLIMGKCNQFHPKIVVTSKETDRLILNRRAIAIQSSPPITIKQTYVMLAKTRKT